MSKTSSSSTAIGATASPPPRPRAGRPPSMPAPRASILAEAARLFADSGYENSAMADVAARLGMSKAAIYHYFRTKQDIYDAIIIETLDGLGRAVGDAVAAAEGPAERLRAFMLAHARYFEANHSAFVAMLVGYSGMSPVYRDDAAQLRDDYERLLRRLIAEGVAQRVFRDIDQAATGRAILSMLNWMARWYKPGQGQDAESVAAGYYDLLLGGLRRPAP
ncbi:TetR/AcrR family transcriptional regulator [Achromobacter aloeverae]|uniref:TetR family transcriptional regulator n=1 Tax=Achromobacter aloeverae TaxID=1750518 RepID=A0A4Q1HL53_9BURK|nr:TetR/AcrR family transcriptional regulator [Achromobacter aloeverae]RXN90355.1 TetR family transcriptional regulator [Achromobacter aloeverae]